MKDNCLFFDISKQERESAIRYLLGAILNCRRESNFPSNYYVFDEDVNHFRDACDKRFLDKPG